MQNLILEQRDKMGLIKSWKLRSEQKFLTFGSSKHADLVSPKPSVMGIQGVFEFRGGKWHYIHTHVMPSPLPGGEIEIAIDKDTLLTFGDCTLSAKPYEVSTPLFSKFGNANDGSTKPYQLFLVYHNGKLLESEVIPQGQKFFVAGDSSKTALMADPSESWKNSKLGPYEVRSRTVHLKSLNDLKRVTQDQLVDEDSKKSLLSAMALAAFVGIFMWLFKSPETSVETALELPQPIQVKMEQPKKKQVTEKAPIPEKPKEQKITNSPPPKQRPSVTPPGGDGGSKALSAIKSIQAGRISQLIGKVSARAAVSKNVVITSGAEAGTTPTGRAMAAIGKMNRSGTDWTAEGKGSGVSISTAGKAGGKGTAGLGAIAGGKAGSGGVGLLEEEGEIVGGLDREIIAQYIKSQLGQILYCYERQLSANPELYGKVAVKFTIGPSGAVETQRIGDSTLKNATVEGCILQRVSKWKFPSPEGGTKVMVTYPFLFKSTN